LLELELKYGPYEVNLPNDDDIIVAPVAKEKKEIQTQVEEHKIVASPV